MTRERSLHEAVDALADSIVVRGFGPAGNAAARSTASDAVDDATEPAFPDATAVFVAVELGVATDAATALVDGLAEDTLGVVVAVLPDAGLTGDAWTALRALRASADAVVLVGGTGDPARALEAGVDSVRDIVGGVGVVNLDLADLRTVLGDHDLAVLASAHTTGDADVVDRTISAAPPGFGLSGAPTVLVHVVGGPGVTVEAAGNVVAGVRERVAPDAHVIWGATVDDDRDPDALDLTVVVGGVEPVATAGDPCPRCGATLVGYSLGERTTAFCETCGYTGVGRSLR